MEIAQDNNAAARSATVMIVDDEEIVLSSLRAMLQLDTDYRVLTYRSPVEALAFLQRQPVDIVICDFLMPEMNGLQFLGQLKKLYPNVPRILLTGYADKGNAILAINEIGLYQYIEKPWDNHHIKLVLRNGLATKTLEDTLQLKLRELDEVLRSRDLIASREESLRQEMDLARQVQQNLLPKPLSARTDLTVAASYLPALEIGGDFYDWRWMDEHRLAVLVADATGHGVQAALSTALLKFAFVSLIDSGRVLPEIVRGMHEILDRGLPPNTFVAAALAIIDTNSRRAEIVNAGLPHPLIYRRKADCVERVPISGLFLGLDLPGHFSPGEPATVTLGAGDRLLLYSDGLAEISDDQGRLFGDGPLSDAIAQHCSHQLNEMIERLPEVAARFGSSPHEADDITLVGVETL